MVELARVIRKRGPFGSREQEGFLSLWRAAVLLGSIQDAFFSKYGVNAHEFNALRILRGEHPGKLAVKEIKERLIARGPDVTRLLDRLAKRGLVARERPRTNRRTVLVTISKKGLDLLTEIDGPLLEMHREQLGHLTVTEITQFIKLLERVRGAHEPSRG